MDIFPLLDALLVTKKRTQIKDSDVFPNFVFQKWASMQTPELLSHCRRTNRLYKAFDDGQMWADGFLMLLPKIPRRRWTYIKKKEQDSAKGKKLPMTVAEIAEKTGRSPSDIQACLDINPKIFDKIDKDVEMFRGRKKAVEVFNLFG